MSSYSREYPKNRYYYVPYYGDESNQGHYSSAPRVAGRVGNSKIIKNIFLNKGYSIFILLKLKKAKL